MRLLRGKMTSFDDVNKDNLKKLKRYGYEEIKIKSKTEEQRFLGKSTIILYKTGKLLVQGNKVNSDEAAKLLSFLGVINEKKGFSGLAIGSDESLKGDSFGGIVVAGFMADDSIRPELKNMGVKDSKKLLNPDIVLIATQLIEKYPKNYHVENIFPKEYNKMNVKHSVTEILDTLHARCFSKISGKNNAIHIVDMYPGCSVGNIRETHAESKYLEVAAASVLARYFALKQIRDLEMKAGFFIPLGSSNIESSLLELKKKSLDPVDYVKLKFQNVSALF
jgi:ribonuclease HIII